MSQYYDSVGKILIVCAKWTSCELDPLRVPEVMSYTIHGRAWRTPRSFLGKEWRNKGPAAPLQQGSGLATLLPPLVPPSSSLSDVAGSGRHTRFEWSPWRAFRGWLELRWFSSCPGRTMQPDFFPFLKSRGVGQAVISVLHPVTGHLHTDL
jgi:hypothetical protein